MTKQHTPGPWKALRSNENWQGIMWDIDPDEDPVPFTRISDEAGNYVALAHDLFEFKPKDAQLIAAAPELLAALQDLVCLAEAAMREAGDYHIEAELQDARAAIAKATKE